MKRVNSFQDVEKKIHKDLAWYMCYESVVRTQQQLNMNFSDAYSSRLSKGIFSYVLEQNFKEFLQNHVYFDQEIVLNDGWINQAAAYFRAQCPNITTMELSSYLSYLDSWTEAYPDWTRNRPIPLKNMTIVPCD